MADNQDARNVLEAERAELLETLEGHYAELESLDSQATTGMGETDHLVNSEHNELTARVVAVTKSTLAEVEAALGRIDDGTYGLCTSCGSAVSSERLAAIPAAAHCVECQSKAGSALS